MAVATRSLAMGGSARPPRSAFPTLGAGPSGVRGPRGQDWPAAEPGGLQRIGWDTKKPPGESAGPVRGSQGPGRQRHASGGPERRRASPRLPAALLLSLTRGPRTLPLLRTRLSPGASLGVTHQHGLFTSGT